jgi:hypothetical protein
LDLILKNQDLAAHPLVFMDDRQIAHADEQQHGQHDQTDDKFRQLAPDAEVNIHPASKTRACFR